MSIVPAQKIETFDISLMIYDQRWENIKLFWAIFYKIKILVYNIKYKMVNLISN